jgi:hypothetical protein
MLLITQLTIVVFILRCIIKENLEVFHSFWMDTIILFCDTITVAVTIAAIITIFIKA